MTEPARRREPRAIPADDELLDYDEVAARLKVDKTTVARLAKTGALRVVYVGRIPRVRPSDLREFIASAPEQPTRIG